MTDVPLAQTSAATSTGMADPAVIVPMPTTLNSFTLFRNLPSELRILIWEKMAKPRVVEVVYDGDEGFTSLASSPMVLQICKESRETLIQSYPLCFGSIFHPAKVRFNFSIDTLYIDNDLEEHMPHLFATFREPEINGLRYLALDAYFMEPGEEPTDEYDGSLDRATRCLKSLREIQVVFDVSSLTTSSIGCHDEHRMELYEGVPPPLIHPKIHIEQLPPPEEYEGPIEWVVPCRPVYGWRRCPIGMDFTSLGAIPDDDSLVGTPFGYPSFEDHMGYLWGEPDPYGWEDDDSDIDMDNEDGYYSDDHDEEEEEEDGEIDVTTTG